MEAYYLVSTPAYRIRSKSRIYTIRATETSKKDLPDTIGPVITLNGQNPATVEKGSTYTDAGATADGGEDVTSSSNVDTSTIGTYIVTYSATDGTNTVTATRTVTVVVFTPADKSDLHAALSKWYEIANDGSANAKDTANSVTVGQYTQDPTTVLYYGNPNTWDVSGITDMSNLFHGIANIDERTVHPEIGNWDTSSVTDMSFMFRNTRTFNQDISSWDTSKVTNMTAMFELVLTFDQNIATKDVTVNGNTYTAWNTSSVQNMSFMLSYAVNFNQPIGNWDTSSVTDMSYMFRTASQFNQYIGNWDTSSVTDMESMFSTTDQFNQYIGNWDTSQVTDMSSMFSNTLEFNQDIGPWDTSSVTNMSSMFSNASKFNQNIRIWDISSIKKNGKYLYDMQYMFSNAQQMINTYEDTIGFDDRPSSDFFNQPRYQPTSKSDLQAALSKWYELANNPDDPDDPDDDSDALNTANSVTESQYTANPTTVLYYGNPNTWDVRGPEGNRIADMSELFKNIANIGSYTVHPEIGNWDTSSVTNMSSMFNGASKF